MLDGDADDLAVLLDADGGRLAGRADDADALRAFVDMPVDQATQRFDVDASVVVHGRDERDDAAGDGFHGWAVLNRSILATRQRRSSGERMAHRAALRSRRIAHGDSPLHEALRSIQEAVFV